MTAAAAVPSCAAFGPATIRPRRQVASAFAIAVTADADGNPLAPNTRTGGHVAPVDPSPAESRARSAATSTRGSRIGKFTCTGPRGASFAAATARAASVRNQSSRSASAPGAGASTLQRT